MLPTPPPSPALNGLCRPEDRLGLILSGWLELTGILGVGAYGVVYTAVDINTSIPYAVKALNKIGLDPRARRFQQREIQLHHEASLHPNIVSLVKIMESEDCTFVVLEYCPEGDLFSNITEEGLYLGNDDLAKRAFLQVLDAVQHCHSLGIYHRDLKPENILVSDAGWTVKLADFGLATKEYITDDFGCGSTFYMSPECQQAPQYSSCYASGPNDVWSLGIILVNLTCGRNPWKRACFEDSTYRAYTRNSHFLRTILPISQELEAILARIFDPDPQKRATVAEVRQMVLACSTFTTLPGATNLSTSRPEPLFTPKVQCHTPVDVAISHAVVATASTSSGSSVAESVSDRSSVSSWSSLSSDEAECYQVKPVAPTDLSFSAPQAPSYGSVSDGFFPGSFISSCYSYLCGPLLQQQQQQQQQHPYQHQPQPQHRFIHQAPLVC